VQRTENPHTNPCVTPNNTSPHHHSQFHKAPQQSLHATPEPQFGFRSTKMTESPLRNILEMTRSLFTGAPFFPFAVRGVSVHISRTPSNTMLQWRSNALMRARSLWLFRRLISTCELFFTLCINTESGPLRNSSTSSACLTRPSLGALLS
jgi:hypothetical protein